MEGSYIDIKLIIGNRESGTGNWFLVAYLSKRERYFKTVDREQGHGNRELVPCSLFWYIILRSQFPFLFKYNWVDAGLWFSLVHKHVRHLMILKRYRYLCAYNEYCQVNVEGAYINMKLIIGNRESGNSSLFLICVNVSDISKL